MGFGRRRVLGRDAVVTGVRAWGGTPIPPRVAQRAFTRWVGVGDCHQSNYSVASHGYAQIGWRDGRDRYGTTAHRAAWVHVNGQIPRGMTVDHICRNRQCVNTQHLRLISNLENARRNAPGRDFNIGDACARGHSADELVTVTRQGRPSTTCGTCRKIRTRRGNWRARKKGPLPDSLRFPEDMR